MTLALRMDDISLKGHESFALETRENTHLNPSFPRPQSPCDAPSLPMGEYKISIVPHLNLSFLSPASSSSDGSFSSDTEMEDPSGDFGRVHFKGSICTDALLRDATQDISGLLSLKVVAPSGEIYSEVTAQTLLEIIRNHPKIESLALSGLPNVTLENILEMIGHLPHLKKLSLNGFEISDAFLSKLLIQRPELSKLSLSHCTQLTDSSLQLLAAKGVNFQKLTLGLCNRTLNPSAIATLFDSLVNVQRLSFRGFAKLNDACIQALATSASQLRRCDLGECEALTTPAMCLPATMPQLLWLSLFGVKPTRLTSAMKKTYVKAQKTLHVNGNQAS